MPDIAAVQQSANATESAREKSATRSIQLHYKTSGNASPVTVEIPLDNLEQRGAKFSLLGLSPSIPRLNESPSMKVAAFHAFMACIRSVIPSLQTSVAYSAYYYSSEHPCRMFWVPPDSEELTQLILVHSVWRILPSDNNFLVSVRYPILSPQQPRGSRSEGEKMVLHYSRNLLVGDAVLQAVAHYDLLFSGEVGSSLSRSDKNTFESGLTRTQTINSRCELFADSLGPGNYFGQNASSGNASFILPSLDISLLSEMPGTYETNFDSSSYCFFLQNERYAFVLNNSLMLSNYDLFSEQEIQLICMNDTVPLGIYIPGEELRSGVEEFFVISPHAKFSLTQVIGMIKYHLLTRKCELISDELLYSCWLPRHRRWLSDSACLREQLNVLASTATPSVSPALQNLPSATHTQSSNETGPFPSRNESLSAIGLSNSSHASIQSQSAGYYGVQNRGEVVGPSQNSSSGYSDLPFPALPQHHSSVTNAPNSNSNNVGSTSSSFSNTLTSTATSTTGSCASGAAAGSSSNSFSPEVFPSVGVSVGNNTGVNQNSGARPTRAFSVFQNSQPQNPASVSNAPQSSPANNGVAASHAGIANPCISSGGTTGHSPLGNSASIIGQAQPGAANNSPVHQSYAGSRLNRVLSGESLSTTAPFLSLTGFSVHSNSSGNGGGGSASFFNDKPAIQPQSIGQDKKYECLIEFRPLLSTVVVKCPEQQLYYRIHATIHSNANDLQMLMQLEDPNACLTCSRNFWTSKTSFKTRTGIKLAPFESIWSFREDCARLYDEDNEECAKTDLIYWSGIPFAMLLTTSFDNSNEISVTLNPTRPMKDLIPGMLRKLGVRRPHAMSITMKRQQGIEPAIKIEIPLECEKSLHQLNVGSGDKIVIFINKAGWLDDSQYIMSSSVKKADAATLGTRVRTTLMISNFDSVVAQSGEEATSNNTLATDRWIWYENAANVVYDKANRLESASFNKLIEAITPEQVTDPEEYLLLVNAFFLTLKTFSTPLDVFRKIRDRYHVPRLPTHQLPSFEATRNAIQKRITLIIELWTRNYAHYFMEESWAPTICAIQKFTETVLAEDGFIGEGSAIRRNLRDVRRSKKSQQNAEPDAAKAFMARFPKLEYERMDSTTNIGGKIFEMSPETVAEQICLMSFQIYAAIQPTELLNQNWTRAGCNELAPNITELSIRLNSMARSLVLALLSTRDVSRRASRMEWVVEIAWHLFEMRNYLMVMACLAALSNAAVSRLKHTKAKMNSKLRKKLDDLEDSMRPKMSFKKYRANLRNSRPGATPEPRIPYLMVHLSDLIYIEDGNPDYDSKRKHLINFSKRRLIYDTIRDVLQYQDVPYVINVIVEIQNILNRLSCLLAGKSNTPESRKQDEEELFSKSLEIEPRGWDGVSKTVVAAKRNSRSGADYFELPAITVQTSPAAIAPPATESSPSSSITSQISVSGSPSASVQQTPTVSSLGPGVRTSLTESIASKSSVEENSGTISRDRSKRKSSLSKEERKKRVSDSEPIQENSDKAGEDEDNIEAPGDITRGSINNISKLNISTLDNTVQEIK